MHPAIFLQVSDSEGVFQKAYEYAEKDARQVDYGAVPRGYLRHTARRGQQRRCDQCFGVAPKVGSERRAHRASR